jgi:hypothetical protein
VGVQSEVGLKGDGKGEPRTSIISEFLRDVESIARSQAVVDDGGEIGSKHKVLVDQR